MAESLGAFEQAVLVCLARLREGAYGLAILHEVRRRLNREVPSGAVYVTLERLERQGLISSRWVPPKMRGRTRRYFMIETEGVGALLRAKADLDSLWDGFVLPGRRKDG